MKKLVCVMIIALAALGTVSALELPQLSLSAGGGGFFAFEPSGGYDGSGTFGGTVRTIESKTNWLGGGAFGFFDATYGELSVGFMVGSFTNAITPNSNFDSSGTFKGEKSGMMMAISIEALGKFPFPVTEQITVFPLLGFEFIPVFSLKDIDRTFTLHPTTLRPVFGWGDPDSPGDYSMFYFRFGGGLDFHFSDSLFLRGEVLYGLRLSTKAEDDGYTVNVLGAKYTMSGDSFLGHGGKVKIAVGYKFMTF
jgi:hypothetical protein